MGIDNSQKPNVKILLSLLSIVIGILLMMMKIVEDGEPGAIPLLIILFGVGWYTLLYVTQRNYNSTKNK